MSLAERLRGAWRELSLEGSAKGEARKTILPAVLSPYRGTVTNTVPKPTAAALRRFADTPVARRAINLVKDRIAAMDWQVQWKRDAVAGDAEVLQRLRRGLEAPNAGDSFRTLMEQLLEDVLVGGFGAVEMELTSDAGSPFRLWPVDGATIQVNRAWDGTGARYVQTRAIGGGVELRDEELMYVRLNARSYTPFGLGRLEVAFETLHQLAQANRYAARLASNSAAQFALWMDGLTPEQHQRVAGWWKDEVEGSGQVPILSTAQKPEVLRFAGSTDAELRLQWQEFLIRMIANAFDIPPMLLGLQSDVNRSTAKEMADEAFESAVKPVARLVAEHITRDLFHKRLGLDDVEFVFNELMARDDASEVSMQLELLKAGVLTVDEVRTMRGYSAYGA